MLAEPALWFIDVRIMQEEKRGHCYLRVFQHGSRLPAPAPASQDSRRLRKGTEHDV